MDRLFPKTRHADTLAAMKALFVAFAVAHSCLAATAGDLRIEATRALENGAKFFTREVAVKGTYLWQYSADLARREGEGKATATQGWIQPPGTPSVGMALLTAWNATSNRFFLDAAGDTVTGLLAGQLRSGGWHYSVDFDPEARRRVAYRKDGGSGARAKNVTTLDDDTTQAALRFLVRADAAFGFTNGTVAEAVVSVVDALAKAQYPNGAWPQGYEEFPDTSKFPVKQAGYPETWSRTWPGSQQYWLRYTLNDNALATTIETMFEVARVYSRADIGKARSETGRRARAAAIKAGEFLLLAQMPEPQPAWAQQYDFEMHPAWARKFEPPAVSSAESKGAIEALMKVYVETGEQKFLAPIPRALEYLRRCRLPDGKLARFYELRTNRPLYFTREYALTYDDRDMPTHYAFKVADDLEAISRKFDLVKNTALSELRTRSQIAPKASAALESEVRSIIAAQDSRGRWVETGRLRSDASAGSEVIRSATFVRNTETLSRYLVVTAPTETRAK